MICLFLEIYFLKNYFLNFSVLFVIRKVYMKIDQQKIIFQSKKNLGGKHFLEVVKKLKISYYLLIISNSVLKLLITIYILFWIFIFWFHLLKFNFYINFSPYFYNCYLFFPYIFFIEIFYLSNLVLILLIVTYFIWNNLWNVNYYYFNFFIFYFFIF